MSCEAAAEDFEHEVEVGCVARAVDDGEGAEFESGGDVSRVIALGAAALHGNNWRRCFETREKFEQTRAAFGEFGGLRMISGGLFERESEIYDGHMDADGLDDVGSLTARINAVAQDAHGFQEAREAVDPGVGFPAGVREEEIQSSPEAPQATRIRAGRSGICGL